MANPNQPVAYAVAVEPQNTTTTITRESDGDCSERDCAIATLVIIALAVICVFAIFAPPLIAIIGCVGTVVAAIIIGAILGTCDSPYLDQNLSTETAAATTAAAAGFLGAAAIAVATEVDRSTPVYQPPGFGGTTTRRVRQAGTTSYRTVPTTSSTWGISQPASRPIVTGINPQHRHQHHRVF